MLRRGILEKRGDVSTVEVGFIAVGLLLAGAVTLGMLKKTVDDIKGTTYEKNYFARDIALALDAVYAAPGDVEYIYSMKGYKFVVEIKNSKVFVKESLTEEDNIAGVYDFFGDPESKLQVAIAPVATPVLITFSKKKGAACKDSTVCVTAENAVVS